MLIPDANVLISFYEVDWFDSISFWRPEHSIAVPEQVWEDEFADTRDVTVPEWIDIQPVKIGDEDVDTTTLTLYDWQCLYLAQRNSGILVTRDKPLKKTASDKGVESIWAGKFLRNTFRDCGIDEADYRSRLSSYIEDAFVNNAVEDMLMKAEKS